MPTSAIDSIIFRDIFGSADMRNVWSDEFRTQQYLDFEAALARADDPPERPRRPVALASAAAALTARLVGPSGTESTPSPLTVTVVRSAAETVISSNSATA